jgi:hypothetical protein
MAAFIPTNGNDKAWLVGAGTGTVDFLGGWDALDMGTSLRSSYTIVQAANGAIKVDSLSGASAALHLTLYNLEEMDFNSGKDVLNLTTYFGDKTPPTVSITDNTAGTAIGAVNYTLTFSEAVTGLTASDFTVTNGSVLSVSGSGTSYSVLVAPAANTEGSMGLTLKAASVLDAASNSNSSATSAALQLIDTKAPTISSFSPGNHASGVAVGSDILVTFSEPIQKGSGSIVLKDAAGATVASFDAATSSNLSVSGATLTINPSADLSYGGTFSVEFAAGILKDLAGNTFGGSTGYSFTTAADTSSHISSGTSANDVFTAGNGNDIIDGGAGIDTVVYNLPRANYTLSKTASGYTVTDNVGGGGTDILTNVERLKFSDASVALDLGGNAGEAAKILGAVFGPAAVDIKPWVGIALSVLDGGWSYEQLAATAVNIAGSTTHAEVAALLWNNLAGFVPTPEQDAGIVALLDNGMSVGQLTVLAADLSLNTDNIHLVGLSQTGIEYA